ncbi:hypothetical protein QJS66_07665 [Kocuria rhizophila]|nr:hypothetical protein QJS66_07665 [Kocuria rhizophila]
MDETVRANIAFGLEADQIDAAAMAVLVERADLTGIVAAALPRPGHPPGERGVRLSGGQRQRVGIARRSPGTWTRWCWTRPRPRWTTSPRSGSPARSTRRAAT